MPVNTKNTGYILELKAAKKCSPNELKRLAQEALSQINERSYDTEMRRMGISAIVKYGVAFSGKSAEVISEELQIT
ncbi:MAG: PD-(D/E)XK nuclease domain-containing protein [Clostridia bacterium]|nr:PD-(D/E)XK nuclease domain-containing protein [Clostridia bacterium]